MRKFHKDDIPQFFDWLKSILALCSAGIGAIAFSLKAGVAIPTAFKWAVGLFLVSTVLTLQSMLIVIEHKRSQNHYLAGWRAFVIIASVVLFLAGMFSVTLHVLG